MLKKLHDNPLNVFWYPIPVIIIIGLLLNGSLGIQMQEALIETSTFKFAVVVSGFLAFSGLAYRFFKPENMIPGLINSHINLTMAGFVILIILVLLQNNAQYNAPYDYYFRIDPREWMSILLFGFGLIIYFINGAIAFFISLKLFGG